MAPTKLRIGVIGVGTRGRQHLTTISELPDHFQLAAVCDLVAPAAEAAAAQAGVPGYTSVHHFLANAGLDVVLIATQAETHHLVAEAVAEHGLSMLIETPLGTTRAMMDYTANVVAKAGVEAEVGENMWRRPTERLNQRAIEAGLIGDVVRVSSYYESAGQDSCYHSMSLLRMYAGADVGEVRAHSHVSSLNPPVSETWTQAQLYYTNGVMGTCTFVTGWIGPLRRGHPRFMSVEGTNGFVVTGDGNLNMLRRVEDGKPLSYPKLIEAGPVMPLRYYYETDPPIEYANPYGSRVLSDSGSTGSASDGFARADELLSIHRVVTEGARPDYTIATARRDQELSIAIHESARLDRTLRPEQMPRETEWERQQHEAFRKEWRADPFKNAGALLR